MSRLRLRDPATLLATWFGIGLLPGAPGTWGSAAALPLAWLVHLWAGWPGVLIAAAILFVIGLWSAEDYAARSKGSDPSEVVIDEVAGQFLTLAVVAPSLTYYALGFCLFRLFDIAKPWPVSWADREIKGGLGIMLDDILAGLYAALLLWLISLI